MAQEEHSRKNNNEFRIPDKIIYFGKFLQTLSPGLAARFLGKIFASPPRFKAPEREEMMKKSAKVEMVHIPSINREIQIYIYGYSKTKILLVHGWSGRGTQLYNLADKILENRMMVISMDAPAHGDSSGKITNMLEYEETLRFIDKKYGPFHAAVGHSWGAMTLLLTVANGLKLNKLVLIGADDRISEVLKSFVGKFQLKPVVAEKIKALYDKKLKINIDKFSASLNAKRVDIPALVIHDTKDRFVPVRSAYRIRQNLKKGQLLITNGLGHHKIFKDPKVIDRIISFIKP